MGSPRTVGVGGCGAQPRVIRNGAHMRASPAQPHTRFVALEMVLGAAGSTAEGTRLHPWSPKPDTADLLDGLGSSCQNKCRSWIGTAA